MAGHTAAHWKPIVLVILALGAAGGVWLLADVPASDPSSARTVDSCTTITDPGRYVLTADITASSAGTCIRIRADDVAFSGAGHRVAGTGAFGTAGIVVESDADRPLSNVTVSDVTVTDWDDGIRYIGVTDGEVRGTVTADNRVGLSLLDTHDTTIADNTARENRLRGISLLESATGNTVANNTATDNVLFGIHLVEGGVSNNTLVGNAVSENEFGIVLVGAHENAVRDNTADRNRIAGIWLSASRGNDLAGNQVSNRFYGVFLADGSTGNSISETVASSNAVGIRLRSSDENAVTDNTLRSNSDTAILLISSEDNIVVRNAGANNARGITVIRSTGNTVENNTLMGS